MNHCIVLQCTCFCRTQKIAGSWKAFEADDGSRNKSIEYIIAGRHQETFSQVLCVSSYMQHFYLQKRKQEIPRVASNHMQQFRPNKIYANTGPYIWPWKNISLYCNIRRVCLWRRRHILEQFYTIISAISDTKRKVLKMISATAVRNRPHYCCIAVLSSAKPIRLREALLLYFLQILRGRIISIRKQKFQKNIFETEPRYSQQEYLEL